jgi:serine/threonine protein kinase
LCASCLTCEAPPTSDPSGEHLDAVQRLLCQAQTGAGSLLPLRDYFVERELGRGGMGAVYLARHLPSGRRVALKVMLPHLADRDDLLARFQREIDNTRALAHPNVVSVFDSGRDGDAYFFTMEFCEGGSVDQLLARRGPLPVGEAVALIRQVLDVLEYARTVRGGVIHRDLKPSNLLLTGSSPAAVKVADYGLARAFEDARLTRSADVLCTPAFCPRQQAINSRDVGPEVDVWAAAACLYYLLTKSFVRDHPPGYDALMVATLQPVVPIRRRRPDLPAALADVIDRALVEEPAVPSHSAAEFREALLAAV